MVLKPSYHLPRGVWLEVLSSVDRSSGRSFGLGQLCGQVTEVNKWVPEGQFILCSGVARDVVMSGFTCAQLPAMWTEILLQSTLYSPGPELVQVQRPENGYRAAFKRFARKVNTLFFV